MAQKSSRPRIGVASKLGRLAVPIGFASGVLLVAAENGPRNLISTGGAKAVDGLKAAAVRFGDNDPPEVAAARAITGKINRHT